MAHKTPVAGKVGFMYMLAGGTEPATAIRSPKPPPNAHWIRTGPHVMVVGAEPSFYAAYPHAADPDTAVPYVMWAGTPTSM
jgi:hypothetical protein